jgi:cell division protease FtsH
VESWIVTILPYLIIFAAMFIFFIIMSNQAAANSGGGNKMMNFGKSRAKMMMDDPAKRVTFGNVAGLKEEKEELEEIVDFLRAPAKYTKLGARIPKGVLLVGPPGTGKTLLAKAIAGEAGVPFFSISGSDFVEMFVGVGASRVRDLFEEAKKNAPCIVFIDEIDAVARRRGTGMGGGHDEREQTLNQMLVEMDGFGVNEGIIVMAATNRVDILDPAIMRPGRFDRKVHVGRPDVGGREEILHVHAKNKPLGDDVDLQQIAQTTAGFTGADLENLLNEAAIVAAKENRAFITQNDIKKSFVKVGIGAEKKSRIISEKEKRITAFHESGHAILFHVLPDVGPVYSVSIIPTGSGAAGYTMPLPEKDEMFNTKGKMLQNIIVSLGGRVAEELVFDDITTGASQDIKQATQMAKAMVTKYGMSENIGLICYDNDDDEVFIGRDLAHTRGYGEGVASAIDQEIKRIIDECYEKARKIITENRDVLDACANLLLEKEKISQQEFEALFEA